MSNTLRNMGLAALLAVSASAFMSSQASALSMADCSAKYKAAKAAGTDGGLKWNDFRKAQCSADAAATPAAPVAAAPVKAAKTVAPAAPAITAATPAATPSGSFMKDCSASWKAMKAANTVPAGMTWKDFVAAKCQVAGAPAVAAPAAPAAAVTAEKKPGILGSMFGKKASVAPPEPSVQPDTTPLATTDKNGKPYTAGQLAAHKRIRACGEQWRGLKAQGKTPAGMAWPQYWSACNKQLKAQGQ
jgi:hypothetical protein